MFGNGTQNADSGHACLTYANVGNGNTCLTTTTGFANDNNELPFGPVARAVTISNLLATSNNSATGQTVTVLDNGVATALGCTNLVGSSCSDTTDSVVVPAGDFLQVRVAGGTASHWRVTFQLG
jgi:hypothetical protein